MRIIDITVALGRESCTYPGDPPLCVSPVAVPGGGDALVTQLSMSCHEGTHVEAPAHLRPGAPRLDAYGLQRLIVPAVIVHAEARGAGGSLVAAADVPDEGIPRGAGVLFRTRNSAYGRATAGVWRDDFVALSVEAAEKCVALGATLVGIDAPSVDPADSEDYPAHHILLAADVLILEGLTLAAAGAGVYELICLPLKLEGTEAAPARAILRDAPVNRP